MGEASSAFLHLIKWFRPDGATLPSWLRRIYTPHQCLMRWTFSVKDIALYLGPVVVKKKKGVSILGELHKIFIHFRDTL